MNVGKAHNAQSKALWGSFIGKCVLRRKNSCAELFFVVVYRRTKYSVVVGTQNIQGPGAGFIRGFQAPESQVANTTVLSTATVRLLVTNRFFDKKNAFSSFFLRPFRRIWCCFVSGLAFGKFVPRVEGEGPGIRVPTPVSDWGSELGV